MLLYAYHPGPCGTQGCGDRLLALPEGVLISLGDVGTLDVYAASVVGAASADVSADAAGDNDNDNDNDNVSCGSADRSEDSDGCGEGPSDEEGVAAPETAPDRSAGAATGSDPFAARRMAGQHVSMCAWGRPASGLRPHSRPPPSAPGLAAPAPPPPRQTASSAARRSRTTGPAAPAAGCACTSPA
jgi:hypothetical protein